VPVTLSEKNPPQTAEEIGELLTLEQWHHVRISLDAEGYRVEIDNQLVAETASDEFSKWGAFSPVKLWVRRTPKFGPGAKL
jgi:hypothetical protein